MSDELKPQSVDSPEFRELLDEFAYRASERRAMGGDFGSAEAEEIAESALIAHIDAWGARLARDVAKDAERYRWLRDKARGEYEEQLFVTDDGHKDYYAPGGIYEHKLDAAVDLAMARKEPPCGS